MEMDFVSALTNTNNSLGELAEALLGGDDDCLGLAAPNLSNTTTAFCPGSSSSWDIDYDLIDQFINNNDNNNDGIVIFNGDNQNSDKTSVGNSDGSSVVVQEQPRRSSKKRKEEAKKKEAAVVVSEGGKKRRKRHPNQVQDHIMAERKRREVLSSMFITLSSIIPGLKKMDKTTILGDAIKHMKQLQEKVKELELAASQHTTNKKSMVVVKKYQLSMIDDDNDDNSGGSDGSKGGCNNSDNLINKNLSSLPEIEVKISNYNNLLLKVYCEIHKGILPKLIALVDSHNLSITSCVALPIDDLILDITIVAQMGEGFNNNIKGFVRTIRSTIVQLTSPQRPKPSIV